MDSPFGPHVALLASLLTDVAAADDLDWFRADRCAGPPESRASLLALSRARMRLDLLQTRVGRPTVDAPWEATRPSRQPRSINDVITGLHAVTFADCLTPPLWQAATACLSALVGPVSWPADHPLCQSCPHQVPLGAYMADAIDAVAACAQCTSWPGMTAAETAVGRTLVRDGEMPWGEIVLALPRLA